MTDAILLLAYGSPDSLADIPAYLADIRGGRPTPPHLLAEITRRYALIGGRSPLLELTRRTADKLSAAVGLPVYVGMRHWRPTIAETVAQMAADGVRHCVAICMAPHYSRLGIGAYRHRLDEALAREGAADDMASAQPLMSDAAPEWAKTSLRGAGFATKQSPPMPVIASLRPANPVPDFARNDDLGFFSDQDAGVYEVAKRLTVDFVESWHTVPAYLEGVATNVRETLRRFEDPRAVKVIFTAHSLPAASLTEGDPYDRQLDETARLLADRLGLPADRWTRCYQSAAQTGAPWLGPQIEALLPDLAAAGAQNLLVAPIGFIADHVEILYDLDIGLQEVAGRCGVRVERTPMLNDTPPLIAALAEVARSASEY